MYFDLSSKYNHDNIFQIRRNLIDIGEEVRKHVSSKLSQCFEAYGGSISLDLWLDKTKNIDYIAFSVHFIEDENDKLILQDRILAIRPIVAPNGKTGELLESEMKKYLREFMLANLTSNIVFVSDRGSNVVKALQKYNSVNCFAHMLNNTVEKVCHVAPVFRILDSLKRIVVYFKATGLNNKLQITLKTFCNTRFNGYCILIESVIVNWDDIVAILNENKRNDLIAGISKQQVEIIFNFLKGFKDATTEIEATNQPTLFLVWPLLHKLQQTLQASDDDTLLVSSMKTAAIDYLNSNVFLFINSFHRLAVFLHPLLKKLKIASDSEKKDIIDDAKFEIEAMSNLYELDNDQPDLMPEQPRKQPPLRIRNNLLSTLFESSEDESDNGSSGYSDITIYQKVEREIKKYESYKVDRCPDFDMLQWWYDHRFDFKYLYKLALKVHSIPASSAAVERCFSKAGIHSKNRPHLGSSALDNLLFLKSNYDLFSEVTKHSK